MERRANILFSSLGIGRRVERERFDVSHHPIKEVELYRIEI